MENRKEKSRENEYKGPSNRRSHVRPGKSRPMTVNQFKDCLKRLNFTRICSMRNFGI